MAVRTASTTEPRIRPKKRFGQHFLEPAWVEKLIRVIAPQSTDTFLEIGPGRGALTHPLAAAAGHVTAFEIDRDLAARLRSECPRNVTVVEGDFLETSAAAVSGLLHTVGGHKRRVAGNLPYNVAAPILFALVDLYAAGVALDDAVVMLQREVAERLMAGPGSREYGVLGILLQRWAHVERLLSLPPGAFRPPPTVHSSVVRLVFHPPDSPVPDEQMFRRFVQAVFTRRRKTLANALLAYAGSAFVSVPDALREAEIDGRRRPETLRIGEFTRLAGVFYRRDGGSGNARVTDRPHGDKRT